MGPDVMTQAKAWEVVDVFFKNKSIPMRSEPAGIEGLFRRNTFRHEVSPKQWADGYLAAFAEAGGLCLVTFDKALARRLKGSKLLSEV